MAPPRLRKIESKSRMAMAPDRVLANINAAFGRNPRRFFDLPQVSRFKGDAPIAIVGGGPSLRDTLEELRAFRHVMVCGSAHDYVVGQGIEPEYCVVADPDPVAAEYIKTPSPTCLYILAACCDKAVWDRLQNFPVVMFHTAGFDDEWQRGEPAIGGGCTVTLKATNLALVLGYGNQHFFGFDSCVASDASHAYETEAVGDLIDVRVEGSNRVFMCAPYMVAQARQFQSHHLGPHAHLLEPTIHGDGLIAEIMKVGHARAAEMQRAK